MKNEDLKTIGGIALTLGLIFLACAIATYVYFENVTFLGLVIGRNFPYRGYTANLLISGIVLTVIGIFLLDRAESIRYIPPPPS